MLVFEHYVSTNCGTNFRWCRQVNEKCAGTRQGNRFSGNMRRVKSCFILKQAREKELGAIIKDKFAKKKLQELVVTFWYDTTEMKKMRNRKCRKH